MPKKKGRKKAKSGNGKKSKETADTWTLKEAVMLYQVEAKEAQANELKENIDNLKLRNDRQKQKNEFLRNEQNRHIKDVVEKARKMEEVSRSQKQTPFEAVEKALEEKLVAIKAEDLHLREVHRQIEVLDEDIEVLSKELQELLNYKEHGQTVDRTHIEVLEKEMRDMETSYAEMKDFFSKSLEVIKCTITKQNEENITKHKELASEGAISNLDKHNGQEFLDNKWLLREVKINRRHIVAVEAEVERLEKESIKVMADLFEQQLEDVKETRCACVLSSVEHQRRSVYAVTRSHLDSFILRVKKMKKLRPTVVATTKQSAMEKRSAIERRLAIEKRPTMK
ncbi:coiled-coil domain-containing protein 83-like isoform X2 [Hydractinia symbiolongicarpus]|uniref:coiled-coil domain-containing protein 83-like isoform X2 n=1 Tax=Hydractinia symbiolongicarpus TaxID=13093 RepID=UPI00254B62CF|nr:coiled-coil domain-containing protein 83-like isoform X2 [Hydractinia symbiolongicarpus]